MNHGHIFRIGSSHDVCEDYCISNPIALILSDGCSSSSYTDIGARLWTAMALYNDGRDFAKQVFDISRRMYLGSSMLDATLLTAGVNTDGTVIVKMYGDGAIAIVKKDFTLEVTKVVSKHSYPNYLSYKLQPKAHEQMRVQGLLDSTIGKFVLPTSKWTNKEAVLAGCSTVNPMCGEPTYTTTIEEDWISVALFSDGVFSVPLEPLGLIPNFMSFKNVNGEFIKRRVLATLKKYEKENVRPYDDISMAALVKEELWHAQMEMA